MNKIFNLNWDKLFNIEESWIFDEFGNPVDYVRKDELELEYIVDNHLYFNIIKINQRQDDLDPDLIVFLFSIFIKGKENTHGIITNRIRIY